MKPITLGIVCLLSFIFLPAQTTTRQRLQIAKEIEHSLLTEELNRWYPLAVDTSYGGFLSTFNYDFNRG